MTRTKQSATNTALSTPLKTLSRHNHHANQFRSKTTRYCRRLAIAAAAVVAVVPLTVKAQQAYCWDAACYDCPNPAPRLCPAESLMLYYDCCIEGCCRYVKWPNLIFLVIIICALLIGCACCCFFIFTEVQTRRRKETLSEGRTPPLAANHQYESRLSRRRAKSAQRQRNEQHIASVEAALDERKRCERIVPIQQTTAVTTLTTSSRANEHRRSTVV